MEDVKDGDKVQYIKDGIFIPHYTKTQEETDAVSKMQARKKQEQFDDPFKEFDQRIVDIQTGKYFEDEKEKQKKLKESEEEKKERELDPRAI